MQSGRSTPSVSWPEPRSSPRAERHGFARFAVAANVLNVPRGAAITNTSCTNGGIFCEKDQFYLDSPGALRYSDGVDSGLAVYQVVQSSINWKEEDFRNVQSV